MNIILLLNGELALDLYDATLDTDGRVKSGRVANGAWWLERVGTERYHACVDKGGAVVTKFDDPGWVIQGAEKVINELINLTHDSELPDTIPFKHAFQCMLTVVIFNDYAECDMPPGEGADIEDQQTSLANAISSALNELHFIEVETGDWLGTLYDWAAEIGYDFSTSEDT